MNQQNIAAGTLLMSMSTHAFAGRASTEFTAPSTDFTKTEFTYTLELSQKTAV